MRQILEYVARQIGVRRFMPDMPNLFARIQATFMGLLPGRPFSRDQYLTLQSDAVATPDALRKLGIEPTTVETIVPSYLGQSRRQIMYDRFRQESSGAFVPPPPPPTH